LRGENEPKKPRTVYTGKTYNSTDAIAEFFNSRGMTKPPETKREPRPTGFEKLRSASSGKPAVSEKSINMAGGFLPGSHVRHAKYGKGLVLRREGSGDNVKLTISFPGFGQKKLIEKFANLQNED
jgi:DNA helicase-2/ATP-dependent DNA helicase PcrA